MVFSILIMIMVSSLLLFMLTYQVFSSAQQSTYADALDGWSLQETVLDLQKDLARLSGTVLQKTPDNLILANISTVNYAGYVSFINTLYRQRTFQNLSFSASDAFFAHDLSIRHDNIHFSQADNLSLYLTLTNETTVSIDAYALVPGTFPLRIELYDQNGNIDTTVFDFIDPQQNQFFNLTNGLRITIDARNLTITGTEPYLLSVILPLNTTVFFNASLSLQSGLFSYSNTLSYPD